MNKWWKVYFLQRTLCSSHNFKSLFHPPEIKILRLDIKIILKKKQKKTLHLHIYIIYIWFLCWALSKVIYVSHRSVFVSWWVKWRLRNTQAPYLEVVFNHNGSASLHDFGDVLGVHSTRVVVFTVVVSMPVCTILILSWSICYILQRQSHNDNLLFMFKKSI